MTSIRSFWVFIFSIITFLSAPASALDTHPEPWQLNFQPAVSPSAEALHDFHNLLMVIITIITIFVTGLLAYVCFRFREKANPVPSKTTHHTLLEVVWTVIPVLILVGIAIPSMKILYFTDHIEEADMTLKVTGYQWYWGYEYPDNDDIAFDSYIIKDEDLQKGQLRLLEVDNRIVLPVETNIRLLLTAADVIHAWAVPSLGIKLDAVPGRVNETWVRINEPGVYRGMCSELCGFYHGFMPIVIEAVSKEEFKRWVERKKEGLAFAKPSSQAQIAQISTSNDITSVRD